MIAAAAAAARGALRQLAGAQLRQHVSLSISLARLLISPVWLSFKYRSGSRCRHHHHHKSQLHKKGFLPLTSGATDGDGGGEEEEVERNQITEDSGAGSVKTVHIHI